MSDYQYVAFGPGSSMQFMDPVVCFVQKGIQNCHDYTNGKGIKDTSQYDNITFIPGFSYFYPNESV